jgi:potassium-transporting ATPase ATP-binding subunit
MKNRTLDLFDKVLVREALVSAVKKLNPIVEMRNPVMFICWVGALMTTATLLLGITRGDFSGFEFQISLWLWFTVIFANFAEALAEGRGKAQAESLRRTRTQVMARLTSAGKESLVPATGLK